MQEACAPGTRPCRSGDVSVMMGLQQSSCLLSSGPGLRASKLPHLRHLLQTSKVGYPLHHRYHEACGFSVCWSLL